nr:hypothetical protein [Tanacetum cinerariifolium]
MEVDIKEDENEPELTYPYEEVDPINSSPPASESEPEDVIRMASLLRRLYGRETAHTLVEKKGKANEEYYGKLILDLGNKVRSSMEERTDAMENLVKKLSNTEEEKAECKKLEKELEEARSSNTLLRMQNERVKRDLYWTRVRAHEFYQNMICRGFVFEERPNEAIDVSVEDKKSPSSEPRGFPLSRISAIGRNDLYHFMNNATIIMPSKSAPLTQAVVCRMIKKSIDVAIAAERARHANVRNDARGSGPVRGQDAAPVVHECTFAGFMKSNPTVFRDVEGAIELRRWFEEIESVFGISECVEGKKVKEYNIVAYTQRFNELALMFPRMVEPERVKVDVYIQGLFDNINGEVTSSKPANLNEVVCMARKLMEQKSQARGERILEGKKRKWESFQSGNSSGKSNQKDNSNSRQSSQNNKKQGNARAITTAPTEKKVSSGSLLVCKCCFTRHDGPCTIKCHNCGKVRHKARYCKEKNVATGANAPPILTCYDCGEQGHTRNQFPKKVKQEEIGEVRGQAYVIKDAEPKGPNVVNGTFLLNDRYASNLIDSGSDRSFVNTRFSSMLVIDPIKIDASYEVELAAGRVVSTNIVLKGCTLNLVNYIFEINLMPIELGTFDVIIGMDCLVKHDAVIVCGEKFVRVPYGNKTLIVESDKVMSRLKSKEKRMEDMPVICDFPKVFPEEFPGIPPPRQVGFRIDLVARAAPVARAPYRLAPSKMKELSVQLQELLEKGFIRPSSSSWGAPI